ncbi:MAG: hypothetical protein IJ651_04615 [Bacteroidales bacterium]|nr:hypothetical protein [Bacteroidales bacterium]
MKKLLFLTAFALAAALAGPDLSAQGGKHEINVFLGGYKAEFMQGDEARGYYGDLLFDATDNIHYGDLADLYEPHYSINSSPVLTVNYHYILKKWLRVGAQLNWASFSGKYWYELSSRPAESFSQQMVSLLPQVKFCIPGARHFRLYGKVAGGMQFNFGSLYDKSRPVEFAWDLVPLGAEWGGQRFYGNAELCYGSIIQGGRIGIGFRF